MKLPLAKSIGDLLVKGCKIRTSYSDMPYLVDAIYGPCNCGRYSDQLGLTKTGMESKSPDHYHITCKDLDKSRSNGEPSYLSGYNLIDGQIKSVWTDDYLIITGVQEGTQTALF